MALEINNQKDFFENVLLDDDGSIIVTVSGGSGTDNFTTGSTVIGDTVFFDRTDTLSAYTADLSSFSPIDVFDFSASEATAILPRVTTNSIGAGSTRAFIGNGENNTITTSSNSSIVGGGSNTISSSSRSFIAGGDSNTIEGSSSYSVILGGTGNYIQSSSSKSFIGVGGECYVIGSSNSFMGSCIQGYMYNSNSSAIVGGNSNRVSESNNSIVGSGVENAIDSNSHYSVIGGGYSNTIDSSTYSSIIGGHNNTINSFTNTHIIGSGITATASHTTHLNNLIVSGDTTIQGALSKGSGTFRIPTPIPEEEGFLYHSFVESPTAGDNIYRWEVTTLNGKATIELPDYYKHLNKDDMVWITPVDNFGRGYGVINENQEKLTIHTDIDGKYNILLIGTRKDEIATNNWKGVKRNK